MARVTATRDWPSGLTQPQDHPAAKLSWTLVDEIRASIESAGAIAERLGVNRNTVRYVRRGKIWRQETRPSA